MERRSKGFALMLFSLILLLGFQSLGWDISWTFPSLGSTCFC